MTTKIQWTINEDGTDGETWNPTLGCSRVSPGCDRCYAMGIAHRGRAESHKGLTVMTDQGVDWNGTVRCMPERLQIPLRRRKATTWFVDSMSDLFHPEVPDEFLEGVLAVMNVTPRHTYQVLTKRPQRMAQVLSRVSWDCNGDVHLGRFTPDELWLGDKNREWYDVAARLPQTWWGTSIESDRYTFRADHLRATPAAVRFLSCEPLLGPLPSLDLSGIDWCIVGGESGPGARPMDLAWARDLVDRCRAAGVPCFVKQLGSRWGRSHHDIGAWPEDLQVREMPR